MFPLDLLFSYMCMIIGRVRLNCYFFVIAWNLFIDRELAWTWTELCVVLPLTWNIKKLDMLEPVLSAKKGYKTALNDSLVLKTIPKRRWVNSDAFLPHVSTAIVECRCWEECVLLVLACFFFFLFLNAFKINTQLPILMPSKLIKSQLVQSSNYFLLLRFLLGQ